MSKNKVDATAREQHEKTIYRCFQGPDRPGSFARDQDHRLDSFRAPASPKPGDQVETGSR